MMEFITPVSREEFLEKLRAKTKEGSPNLAVTPFAIFKLFEPTNQQPFYGIIRKNGFHISVVKGIRNYSIALDAELSEQENRTVIHAKIQHLVFPIFLGSIVLIGMTAIPIIAIVLSKQFFPFITMLLFPVITFLLLRAGFKKEKRKLVSRFLEETNATILSASASM